MSSDDRSDSGPAVLRVAAVLIVAHILLGGVRFVDGSALYALSADGLQADLPEHSQYLFDSPLKVALLYVLVPTSHVANAVLFTALGFVPLLVVLTLTGGRARGDAILFVALLPLHKLYFQNIGIGDGVTTGLALALILAERRAVVGLACASLILWHFQQGLFIAATLGATLFLRAETGDRQRVRAILAGAFVGLLGYVLYRLLLAPEYHGRLNWALGFLRGGALRFLATLPVSCLVLVSSALLLLEHQRFGRRAHQLLAAGAIAAAVLISGLTADISRVMLLLASPLVLLLIEPDLRAGKLCELLRRDPLRFTYIAAVGIMAPLYSWSGIDLFIWDAAVEDFVKYLGRPQGA